MLRSTRQRQSDIVEPIPAFDQVVCSSIESIQIKAPFEEGKRRKNRMKLPQLAGGVSLMYLGNHALLAVRFQ